MSIDFGRLRRQAQRAARDARRRTDEKLASSVSSLTVFTDEEVRELFPRPADVERLARLMEIVKSSDSDNRRLMRLKDNIDELGGTVLKLLALLA